jgi:hypothetical protein
MARSRRKSPPVRLRRTVGARRFDWTEELAELLGALPDPAVAAKAGIDRQTVADERRRRGIPPARPRRPNIEWTDEMLALLGADSDAAVARELGVHVASVARKRRELGIPAFHAPRHDNFRRFPWRPEHMALLGKVSDGELAKRLRTTRTTVRYKRQQLGVPPFQPAPRPIEWTSAMIERLGGASDARVAEELGISVQSVKHKRQELGIPATLENLPVERNKKVAALLRLPNTEVKHRTGLDWSTIERLRGELGIEEDLRRRPEASSVPGLEADGSTIPVPAADSTRPAGPAPAWRARYSWKPEEIAFLGSAPDAEIAARIGRTVEAVRARRQKLGLVDRPIRPWRPWQPQEIELLGTASDVEVAARLGRSRGSVGRMRRKLGIPAFPGTAWRRWRAHEVELLGTARDGEVAVRLGRSTRSVGRKRRALEIPAFPRTARWRWTTAEEALIGTAPDAEIARRVGRTVEAVRTRRSFLHRKRGRAASRPTP